MKTKLLIFFALLALTISTVSAYIGRVYPDELNPGLNILSVTLYNSDTSIYNPRIQLFIPYANTFAQAQITRLEDFKPYVVYFQVNVPRVAPGYYPVIITIQNEDVSQEKHTWVYIN